MTIVDAFRKVRDLPGRTGLFLLGDREVSFRTALDRVQKLSRFFKDRGLVIGDRVVIATHDDCAAAVLFLALLRNGITAVPVEPQADARTIDRIKDVLRPRGFFLDAAVREQWRPGDDRCVLEITSEGRDVGAFLSRMLGSREARGLVRASYPGVLRDLEGIAGPIDVDRDTDACVLFGPGSGPEGVRIRHRDLLSHIAAAARKFGYDAGSRIMNTVPLACGAGLVHGPLTAFMSAAGLYLPGGHERNDAARLIDALYRHRITHLVTTPQQLSRIARSCEDRNETLQTGDLQCIVSLGGQLDVDLIRTVEGRTGVRIIDAYEATEIRARAMTSGPPEDMFPAPTEGAPAGNDTAIDPQDELARRIIVLAAPCFKVEPAELTIHTGLNDTTGWDSFAHLELITALEAQFKVRLSSGEVMQIKRLSDAWRIVRTKL